MLTSNASRPSIWLAICTFVIFLVIFFLSHASNLQAHQNVVQIVSILFFGLTIYSLRYPEVAASTRPPSISRWWVAPALAMGALTYLPMLPLGFISDDFTHVRWAQGNACQILWEQLTRGQYGSFFRPLGFASIALDYRLWNNWAPGWHLTNLSLHLACAISVFYLCKELGCDAEFCGTGALIFAVLPVGTEAVTWMGARFDLIATLFMLWTLVLYLRARTRNSGLYYSLALVSFALALLSKESSYILPLALIAIEALVFNKKRWLAIVPFLLIAGAGVAYRFRVLGSSGGYPSAGDTAGSLTFGIKSLIGILVRAPSQLIFAVNWQQPRVVLRYFLAAAIAALVIPLTILRPRGAPKRLSCLAVLWCFFAALPAQSLLMIPPSLTNTRVLYFSSVGAALLLALLLERISAPIRRLAWTLALVVCFVATTRHNISAWAHTSKVTGDFLNEVKQRVPNPQPGSEFVLHDMPRWTEGGVYLLLHRALGDGICLTYGRDDLTARRDDEPSQAGTLGSIDLYWVGDWRGKKRPLIDTTRKADPR